MDRNWQIIEAVEAGETYQSIGERFGISKQRVAQICYRSGLSARFGVKPSRVALKPKKTRTSKPIPLVAEGIAESTGRAYAIRLYPILDTCEDCNKVPATVRHHINENPLDNRRENVAFLCDACHGIAHRKESSYGR